MEMNAREKLLVQRGLEAMLADWENQRKRVAPSNGPLPSADLRMKAMLEFERLTLLIDEAINLHQRIAAS